VTDVFRSRARTFWFASHFVPADCRATVAGLYAFARAIDDLVDEPSPTLARDDVLHQLAAWRAWLDQPLLLPPPPDRHLAASLAPALRSRGLPAVYLQMLVDGVASDLNGPRISSWSELRGYCVQVASSVGLAMCHLLGVGDDPLAREAAIELGIAMQLTNILRDIGADLRAGRVYVPADDLAAHGYCRDRLARLAAEVARSGPGVLDDQFRDLMRTQIARARAHYARGIAGVARLPADGRLAILLAARLYRAILNDIEGADYDVFTRRAATSSWFKLGEVVRCAFVLRQPDWLGAGLPTPGRAERMTRARRGASFTADALPLVRS
jgi:15-cis-phytoene synthase